MQSSSASSTYTRRPVAGSSPATVTDTVGGVMESSSSAVGKSASTSATASRSTLPPPPSTGFRLAGCVKELHGHPIYCVAWSTDFYHEGYQHQQQQQQQQEEQPLEGRHQQRQQQQHKTTTTTISSEKDVDGRHSRDNHDIGRTTTNGNDAASMTMVDELGQKQQSPQQEKKTEESVTGRGSISSTTSSPVGERVQEMELAHDVVCAQEIGGRDGQERGGRGRQRRMAVMDMGSGGEGGGFDDVMEVCKEKQGEKKKSRPRLLRCFATCGGNQVAVYEVESMELSTVTNPMQAVPFACCNGGSGCTNTGLTMRQAYLDPDEEEIFYACAFGGRSVGSLLSCDYGPLGEGYESQAGQMFVLTADDDLDDNVGDGDRDGGDNESTGEESDSDDDDCVASNSAINSTEQKASNASSNQAGTLQRLSGSKRRRGQKEKVVVGPRSSGSCEQSSDTSLSHRCSKDARRHQRKFFQSLVDLSKYDGPQLLCVAGQRGIIKVIDTVRRMLLLTLSGHGDEIYDMKFSPVDEWLLLSASKDESLRLWNVRNATCVAIFAGHEGHRDSVLSLGWHPLGDRFVSSGMDTTVKIWSIQDGTEVCAAIDKSFTIRPRNKSGLGVSSLSKRWQTNSESNTTGVFRTVYEQMPIFSTNKVHTDYVDCVQFVGDLVLSKSITDTIVLWQPDMTAPDRSIKTTNHRLPNNVIALREFTVNRCDVWFIRFHTDDDCRMLAIGNNIGEIKVWEIGGSSFNPLRKHFANLTTQLCNSTVRMVSFSPDSKCLVATCDDSSVWKWDSL